MKLEVPHFVWQSYSNKNSMVLMRKIDTDKWNRLQFRTNPCLYDQLIFDKGSKSVPWGKSTLGKSCWENWINSCRAMKLDPYLTPHTKNSKLNKDLNIRPDTIKLLEKNVEKQFLSMGIGKNLLDMTTKAQIT